MNEQPVWLPQPAPGDRIMLIEMDYEDLPVISRGGDKRVAGMTLRRLLDAVGGFSGSLPHPFTEEPIPVSLERWRGRDPESVWIYIAFVD